LGVSNLEGKKENQKRCPSSTISGRSGEKKTNQTTTTWKS